MLKIFLDPNHKWHIPLMLLLLTFATTIMLTFAVVQAEQRIDELEQRIEVLENE